MSDSKHNDDKKSFGLAGVMGWPVSHSRSPTLHGHWLREHQLSGAYVQLAVAPGRLETALRGLAALGFRGCNVTQPHKIDAFGLVDELDPIARRMGAINCIVVQDDGRLKGYNHDGFGYIQSLRDAQPGWRADAGPAVVLGAGGAARAVVLSLIDEGAREIRLINRSTDHAEALKAEFGGPVTVLPWAQRHAALEGAALLVNTTNQGMHGTALDLALDALPPTALVSDVIYVPRETPLLAAARARGNPTVNGLGMLLNQARPAFQSWFGVMPEITPALRSAIAATF